ncbi:hypothetical protein jhhlp_005377 [Lomentospora prolificans]|uniref:Uncharacterized protein n=1 Tax=Lomentospora prolificans TaxID=41688 RepID=A0A2N3N6V1_9PEZI|nr:hypothetical protein jhhlp_005377 [Lomentospora prolificans]
MYDVEISGSIMQKFSLGLYDDLDLRLNVGTKVDARPDNSLGNSINERLDPTHPSLSEFPTHLAQNIIVFYHHFSLDVHLLGKMQPKALLTLLATASLASAAVFPRVDSHGANKPALLRRQNDGDSSSTDAGTPTDTGVVENPTPSDNGDVQSTDPAIGTIPPDTGAPAADTSAPAADISAPAADTSAPAADTSVPSDTASIPENSSAPPDTSSALVVPTEPTSSEGTISTEPPASSPESPNLPPPTTSSSSSLPSPTPTSPTSSSLRPTTVTVTTTTTPPPPPPPPTTPTTKVTVIIPNPITITIFPSPAVVTVLPPPPPPPARPPPYWEVQNFTRTCNRDDTSCNYYFGIATFNDPWNEPLTQGTCNYTITGSGASRLPAINIPCEGGWRSSSAWSGQFGPGNGFTVFGLTNYVGIIWPAYADWELTNGVAVKPNKWYWPQWF